MKKILLSLGKQFPKCFSVLFDCLCLLVFLVTTLLMVGAVAVMIADFSNHPSMMIFMVIIGYLASVGTYDCLVMVWTDTAKYDDRRKQIWIIPAVLRISASILALSYKDDISPPPHAWVTWKSSDGNATILNCGGLIARDKYEWRVATEEELYKYKEEFPRNVPGFVYAGGSLIFGEDPKTGAQTPYVLGYAPVGYAFFPALTELRTLGSENMQLVIKKNVPIVGRLEEYAGGNESIGIFVIPKKSDIR